MDFTLQGDRPPRTPGKDQPTLSYRKAVLREIEAGCRKTACLTEVIDEGLRQRRLESQRQ